MMATTVGLEQTSAEIPKHLSRNYVSFFENIVFEDIHSSENGEYLSKYTETLAAN